MFVRLVKELLNSICGDCYVKDIADFYTFEMLNGLALQLFPVSFLFSSKFERTVWPCGLHWCIQNPVYDGLVVSDEIRQRLCAAYPVAVVPHPVRERLRHVRDRVHACFGRTYPAEETDQSPNNGQ